ncbi:MAG: 6,7-dimethyl-8-ribityllumazine synthase, partial [Armatimonadetes bacterium]|nr:6,7-dimethyl-8-ribityllumazine synthase [Armatimonadota bacterium]NIM24116.1 6,7-dimethyl-8-ribityllumazine synthase [Armatimonadota bacterium]NIM67971.1 6,7-dimethyl-8-ribityllumazine synthase [Armatimonadota bacterium]NIM76484.1 6,7-dimethyl-8-ribityllumazine synthase [Armatimonadota bacterium]NIN06200.1 6,7-dimethyl-8-ribityllumazine synthase [Armatimonadota bacterium]
MKTIEGNLLAAGRRFGVVVSRFNELISTRLLEGALDILSRHGAKDTDIEVAWTPGTFEMPLVAKTLAESKRFDAIICLGAIIRGGTPHFEYIAAEAAKGIAQVNLSTGIPAIFGIITADTIDQAVERAGTKSGNKGADAAKAAIEMANLMREVKKSR